VLIWRFLRDGGGSRAAPTLHNDKRFRAKHYSNLPRTRATEERPEGLVYRPDLITEGEERDLLAFLERVELHEIVMRGQTARRTVHHYGWDYDYSEYGKITAGDPLPDELAWARDRAAELAELEPAALEQALVSRYPAGAGIGWHRDAPMFGSQVIGISLASACRMRFQRGKGASRQVYAVDLEPRSGYVLGGAARSSWQHSIPATKALRYSITFRTLREG
jgi:alkylated DNA repair protein (DNA oxidative demethylase)